MFSSFEVLVRLARNSSSTRKFYVSYISFLKWEVQKPHSPFQTNGKPEILAMNFEKWESTNASFSSVRISQHYGQQRFLSVHSFWSLCTTGEKMFISAAMACGKIGLGKYCQENPVWPRPEGGSSKKGRDRAWFPSPRCSTDMLSSKGGNSRGCSEA